MRSASTSRPWIRQMTIRSVTVETVTAQVQAAVDASLPKRFSLTDPDGIFSRADFVFNRERNVYVCPGGAELTSTGNADQGHIVYYRATKSDCASCSLKPKCTTAVVRKITRDLNEEVRDRVRALAKTEAFQQSRRERKKVEMRFAHMKRIFRFDRLRLRGLEGRP
jgi:Transposase DDE domain